MEKLYYTIGEVAQMLNVNTSLIRYWEKQFSFFLKPKRNKKGARVYTEKDIQKLKLLYFYIREMKYTLDGTKKILKQHKEQITDKKMEAITRLKDIKQELQEILEKL